MKSAYFSAYEHNFPPSMPAMSPRREALWQMLAAMTLLWGAKYISWRWGQSINPDAVLFSVCVAVAETVAYIGTIIFIFDIWREGDTTPKLVPDTRADAALDGEGAIHVDIYVTTFDESAQIVDATLLDAKNVLCPEPVELRIYVLDDGDRASIKDLALAHDVGYISRADNEGFKAGNLRNALFQTRGDFIVICDADTRLLPNFLADTLGYFRDPNVAWVQTPHWFYDIPEGEDWRQWTQRKHIPLASFSSRILQWATGRPRAGVDPYLSDPVIFFDVIQRRRNRHGASFCCGAGSVHRREAIFQNALKQNARERAELARKSKASESAIMAGPRLQPFRFHVSEDIYTSILLHSDATREWVSVYHPQALSRMLSPWSIDAWTAQKLKYAGGTFDIMLNANPLFKRGMKWSVKLHYLATFWSYFSVITLPILLLAPVFALLTGVSPVDSYSIVFFAHLLPLLIANECAMMVGCKGHNPAPGRILAVATLPIQLRAFWCVLRGEKPKFKPTPKTPGKQACYRRVWPNIALLALFAIAAIVGGYRLAQGHDGFTVSLLIVNLFWLSWNALSLARGITAAAWVPPSKLSNATTRSLPDALDIT